MVTLTWHACKYKVHKLYWRYILLGSLNLGNSHDPAATHLQPWQRPWPCHPHAALATAMTPTPSHSLDNSHDPCINLQPWQRPWPSTHLQPWQRPWPCCHPPAALATAMTYHPPAALATPMTPLPTCNLGNGHDPTTHLQPKAMTPLPTCNQGNSHDPTINLQPWQRPWPTTHLQPWQRPWPTTHLQPWQRPWPVCWPLPALERPQDWASAVVWRECRWLSSWPWPLAPLCQTARRGHHACSPQWRRPGNKMIS